MGHFLKRGLFVSIFLCALLMITGCVDTSKKLSKKVRKKTDKIMQAIVEKDSAYLKSELCEMIRSRKSGNVDEDVAMLIKAIDGEIDRYEFESDCGDQVSRTHGKTTKYERMIDYKIYTKNGRVYIVRINYCLIDVKEKEVVGINNISIKDSEGNRIIGISQYEE